MEFFKFTILYMRTVLVQPPARSIRQEQASQINTVIGRKQYISPLRFFFPYNSNLGSFKRPSSEYFKSNLENVRETIAMKITDNKAKELVDVTGWRRTIRNA